jgi:hypothetical protein
MWSGRLYIAYQYFLLIYKSKLDVHLLCTHAIETKWYNYQFVDGKNCPNDGDVNANVHVYTNLGSNGIF